MWTLIMLVIIHWFCCSWGLISAEIGTQRTFELEAARLATFNQTLLDAGATAGRRLGPAAVIKLGGSSASSSGTGDVDVSNCERGAGPCLSYCERIILSQLNGWTDGGLFAMSQQSWSCRAVSEGKLRGDFNAWHRTTYMYLLSGFGMITPSNLVEYSVFFLISFIFLVASNMFVAVVAAAQSEADPQTKEFKARMDHLNHFLTDMAVPLDLKQRTRDYFRFTRDLFRKKSYGDLYDVFSPKLRGDVLCHIAIKTLEAVYYFKGCERGFLNALSQRLTHFAYEQGEPIAHYEPTLCIVTRGTAVRGGKPITLNQYWGEDMIVTSAALRDKRPGAALTYVEIVSLKRSALLECMKEWPNSRHDINIAAATIAMGRAPCLIAEYLSKEKKTHVDLTSALQNLGRASTSDDKELHAVMKRINGGRALRGFARELVASRDPALAKVSAAAVAVAGDEGRLLVDEEGRMFNREGDTVEVADEDEDASTKELKALRTEVREANAIQRKEVHELRRMLGALVGAQSMQLQQQQMQQQQMQQTWPASVACHPGTADAVSLLQASSATAPTRGRRRHRDKPTGSSPDLRC